MSFLGLDKTVVVHRVMSTLPYLVKIPSGELLHSSHYGIQEQVRV